METRIFMPPTARADRPARSPGAPPWRSPPPPGSAACSRWRPAQLQREEDVPGHRGPLASSVGSWNTKPISRWGMPARPSTPCHLDGACPTDRRGPATSRSTVLFLQPGGPRRLRNSPSPTSRLRPAGPPRPLEYVLATSRMRHDRRARRPPHPWAARPAEPPLGRPITVVDALETAGTVTTCPSSADIPNFLFTNCGAVGALEIEVGRVDTRLHHHGEEVLPAGVAHAPRCRASGLPDSTSPFFFMAAML